LASSSDFDGSKIYCLGLSDRPSASRAALDKKDDEADFGGLIYYWEISFGTERGVGRV